MRGDKIVVVGLSRTPAGFYVANEWSGAFPIDVADEDLGGAAISAVAATRLDAPQPGRFPTPEWLAVRELLGVRSEAALNKGAKQVQVQADATDEPIRCVPSMNTGRGFGTSNEPDVEVDRGQLTAARLGAAVREAMSRSE